jgi:hypothetical protein
MLSLFHSKGFPGLAEVMIRDTVILNLNVIEQ